MHRFFPGERTYFISQPNGTSLPGASTEAVVLVHNYIIKNSGSKKNDINLRG
jgi:hypothetical protein